MTVVDAFYSEFDKTDRGVKINGDRTTDGIYIGEGNSIALIERPVETILEIDTTDMVTPTDIEQGRRGSGDAVMKFTNPEGAVSLMDSSTRTVKIQQRYAVTLADIFGWTLSEFIYRVRLAPDSADVLFAKGKDYYLAIGALKGTYEDYQTPGV